MMIRSQRRRRRREDRNAVLVATTGAVVMLVILALVKLSIDAANGPGWLGYRTIDAEVPNSGNLEPHDAVTVHGVRIGQVLSIDAAPHGSRLTLRIDPDTRPIPADSTVSIRGQGLLGQLYVQVNPGSSRRALPAGGTLTGGTGSLLSGVPDVLKTFDPRTRTALGQAIDGLGTGVAGLGPKLNQMVHTAPGAARQFGQLSDQLLSEPTALRQLMPALEQATAALDAAHPQIDGALESGSAALHPFNAQRAKLQQVLTSAPPAMSAATTGLARGETLVDAARAVAVSADATLPPAPSGLADATALLRDSDGPLARATALLRTAAPAVPAAITIVHRAAPLLAPVDLALRKLSPLITTLGAHSCDLANFASNWRSTLGYGIPAPDGGAQLPSGRIGPLDTFKITVAIGASPIQGVSSDLGLGTEDTYPAACKYAPGPTYATAANPTVGQ